MPILSRYLLRLFLPSFALCLGVFTVVLLMNTFMKLFSLAIAKGISPLWIAACFASLMPYFLSMSVPMAFLVSMLLALGQLGERGELLALRASGFSFREMTAPFFLLAAALSGGLLYINHRASPDGFHAFREQQAQAAQQIAKLELRSDSFVRLGPWRLYTRVADPQTGRVTDAYLVKAGVQNGARVSAPRGSVSLVKGHGVVLELEDGDLQLPNRDLHKLTTASFKRYRLQVPLSGGASRRAPDMQELDSPTLRSRINDPSTTPEHRHEYAVEIAVRSAGAASPFVFFWLGAPLGMDVGRMGRARGFIASLLVLFAFYGLMAVGIGLGRRYENLAELAPWTADAAGLIAGLWLSKRAAAA